jgi:hypothetical protein
MASHQEGLVVLQAHIVSGSGELFPICPLHCDASVMNRSGECDECLDDAHELEILSR